MKKNKVKIYYQPGTDGLEDSIAYGPRIRYLYPDGTVTWQTITSKRLESDVYANGHLKPCWMTNNNIDKFSSVKEAIRAMNKYDKDYNFPPAVLIGEL